MSLSMHTVDEMADLILANGEKIAKFAKITRYAVYAISPPLSKSYLHPCYRLV